MLSKLLLPLWIAVSLEIAREGLGQQWRDRPTCAKVYCSEGLMEGRCIQGNDTVLQVQACPPLHACTEGLCTVRGTSAGLPGDSCVSDSDCVSGKCEHHCCYGHGFLEKCEHTSECDQGLFCLNELCWKQLGTGSRGCKSDYDCENNSGCGAVEGKEGICQKYFSVQRYGWVADCVNYFSRLCESGSCFAPGGSGKGICIEAIQSDPFYLYAPCDSHLDCDSLGGEFAFYGLCQCGGNSEGRKYCAPFPGDPVANAWLLYFVTGTTQLKVSSVTRSVESRRPASLVGLPAQS